MRGLAGDEAGVSAFFDWIMRVIAALVGRPSSPPMPTPPIEEPPLVDPPEKIPIVDTSEENAMPDEIKFLQARHFTPAQRTKVDLVVLHSAEIGEVLDGAEILMRRCAEKRVNAKGDEVRSSWHFAVDADSITQSVLEHDVAWHAPGANATGIGIEMTGRARQTATEWADPFSMAMLARCARLVADLCNRWGIPAVFVPADALVRGVRGITTHMQVSIAWRKSSHTDPGPSFDIPGFIDLVRREIDTVA